MGTPKAIRKLRRHIKFSLIRPTAFDFNLMPELWICDVTLTPEIPPERAVFHSRFLKNGVLEVAQNLRVASSDLYIAWIPGKVTNSHRSFRISSVRELEGPCGKIFRHMALKHCLHHFSHKVVKIARNGNPKGTTEAQKKY